MFGIKEDGTRTSSQALELMTSKHGLTEEHSPSPPELADPKHGKEDPNNDPHIGGNTWAGGTGGRDTAGLGGKGGPYRLDKGHDVHQLSDEEKADVPEHIRRAAKAQADQALRDR